MRGHEKVLSLRDRSIVRCIDEKEPGAALRELAVVLDITELGAEKAGEADLEALHPGRAAHRLELLRDERARGARHVAVVETGIDEDLAYLLGALRRIERGDDIV